jgi:hypothetical protein
VDQREREGWSAGVEEKKYPLYPKTLTKQKEDILKRESLR